MTDQTSLEPPKRDALDNAHLLVKAGLSAVPVLGGPAAELFAALVAPPLERRRDEWMQAVGRGLAELLSKDLVTFDQLASSDTFIDTILQASQAAMRTADADKRAALRNAVLNAALPDPPENSLQLMFLSLVDQFTPWHLRILRLFQDPAAWTANHGVNLSSLYMAGIATVLEMSFPELQNRRTFYDQVWAELYQRGLVNSDSLHTTMTSAGLTQQRTTELGNRFLRFIEEPPSIRGDA